MIIRQAVANKAHDTASTSVWRRSEVLGSSQPTGIHSIDGASYGMLKHGRWTTAYRSACWDGDTDHMPALTERRRGRPHCGRRHALAYHNAIVLMAIVDCIVGQRCLHFGALSWRALSALFSVVLASLHCSWQRLSSRARWLPLCSLEKR